MGVKIKSVAGDNRNLSPGDEIVSIDGKKVRDQLDILFNMGGEERARLRIRKKNGNEIEKDLDYGYFEREGITFREMEFRTCGSKCIFCFVDQMPRGLRDTLYCKDDDYRLSFLFGNYITLNDISESDISRIIEYHLSPLYVSVHAVDRELREYIFGRPIRNEILQVLGRLADEGITFHAQIVLVPGVNDGRYLSETVQALAALYPGCRSLSIVPVGLTRHRKNLPLIEDVTAEKAEEIFRWKDAADKMLEGQGELKDRFFYLSDEFYLLTGREIPPDSYYGEYFQIDNGVGMSRIFIEEIKAEIERLKREGLKNTDLTVITGRLGGRLIDRYIMPLVRRGIPECSIQVVEVENRLFGEQVTVSGLLSGSDIIAAARRADSLTGRVVIPPNAVNHRGKLIDDSSVDDIAAALEREVILPESNFLERAVTGI